MPKKLERELWARVRRLHPGWGAKRKRAYVYGTLRKTGWVPRHQRNSHSTVKAKRGYKKCLITFINRKKWTTPKQANRAFSMAKNHCRKHISYKRKK